MQYRTLGRTGIQVSSLVLGAMNFGAIGRVTQDEATAIIDAALDGGINFIDTADFYGQGQSEEMVGRAVERLAKVADQAGLTMIALALGFVTAHPAVTSAIIGPRTLDHLNSQLAAADTVLSGDVLDAIDAIVDPGVDLAPDEKFDTPPALIDPALRRR